MGPIPEPVQAASQAAADATPKEQQKVGGTPAPPIIGSAVGADLEKAGAYGTGNSAGAYGTGGSNAYWTDNDKSNASDDHIVPKNLVQALLYRSKLPDDESLVGVTLREGALNHLPEDKPAQDLMTPQALWNTLKRMPLHYARETAQALPVMIMGSLPVVIAGLCTRGFRMSIPEHQATLKELEMRTGEMSFGQGLLGSVGSILFCLSISVNMIVVARGLWRNSCFTYWGRCYGLWCTVNIAYFIVRPMLMAKSANPGSLDRIGYLANVLSQAVCIVGFFYLVGKANKNVFFFKHLLLLFISIVGTYFVYRIKMPEILQLPDIQKILFVALVNPLISQAFQVLPARLACRAFHHNDPSTSWVFMQVCLTWEKAYSRLVIASMSNLFTISIASAGSALGSGAVLALVGFEDHRVYTLLGKLTGWQQPTVNITNRRNKAFRTSIYVFDFAAELTMILAFGCFYMVYDVQKGDGTLPSPAVVIPSMLMQIGMQYATNIVQVIFVTHKHRVDFITLAYWRCNYWSLMAGACILFPLSMMCSSMFVSLLCGAPEGSGVHWTICA